MKKRRNSLNMALAKSTRPSSTENTRGTESPVRGKSSLGKEKSR
jgi:hypothetical protein